MRQMYPSSMRLSYSVLSIRGIFTISTGHAPLEYEGERKKRLSFIPGNFFIRPGNTGMKIPGHPAAGAIRYPAAFHPENPPRRLETRVYPAAESMLVARLPLNPASQ